MREAWLFALAYRAHLPDTGDFVMFDLFSIFAYILCAEVGRIPTFDFLCKKLKILPFYVDESWERWNFSGV